MRDPSDDRPIAPHRPLARPADRSSQGGPGAYPAASYPGQSQPQPAMSGGHYAGSSSTYSPGDAQTERSSAVPSAANTGRGQGSSPTVPSNPPPGAAGDGTGQRAQKRGRGSSQRTVRRAKLRVVRLDPWSVTKASFLLSIAFGVMCVVAVFLVFSIMSASGLWDNVNSTIQGVVNQKPADAFDINDYVGMSRVMGVTMLISAIDVVIITALTTLGAFIYNMAASLLGGIEITLAEDLRG